MPGAVAGRMGDAVVILSEPEPATRLTNPQRSFVKVAGEPPDTGRDSCELAPTLAARHDGIRLHQRRCYGTLLRTHPTLVRA
jgi:hypothetical protein